MTKSQAKSSSLRLLRGWASPQKIKPSHDPPSHTRPYQQRRASPTPHPRRVSTSYSHMRPVSRTSTVANHSCYGSLKEQSHSPPASPGLIQNNAERHKTNHAHDSRRPTFHRRPGCHRKKTCMDLTQPHLVFSNVSTQRNVSALRRQVSIGKIQGTVCFVVTLRHFTQKIKRKPMLKQLFYLLFFCCLA